MAFTEITPERAWDMIQTENAVLLDVRDAERFSYSRAQGAFHLTNQSYGEFQDTYDFDHPVIVSCYHGISSRSIAAFLAEQGYDNVYSVIGGFEGWQRAGLPMETAYGVKPI
ncbi:Rhodanese domain protein [Actinobacillus succinogenes 130Z]|uniref:Thiosulfate sulfurtransferase GlpE n=1 Tax=Actinobacillus succinogenes (strain ATCC 55618 / DSM 22257 / CCUG 43843 / 130Z) TaxID=339671 RepID=GLPE_ACTSZ|nr:RecName: Full=Thiosulfate sulfurtransferase GlpE [Actinobacillus succinogenes 130Z]ABR73470.1 Rhodanese domain protein [Actinobacillus succinogenes 130Z]